MAHTISLMSYLQEAMPAIPVLNSRQGTTSSNTKNANYGWRHVTSLGEWEDFNFDTIRTAFHEVLYHNSTRIPLDAFPSSQPQMISSEDELKEHFSLLLYPRVRRSVRQALRFFRRNGQMGHRTPVVFANGNFADTTDGFLPDLGFHPTNVPQTTGPNRLPGDVKPSWKWSPGLRNGSQRQRREYRQVLSQVLHYMKMSGSRYGFIITDQYLVAFRRSVVNGSVVEGHLDVAPEIPLSRSGTHLHPRLTALMALWYLGVLASEDNGALAWNVPQ